MISDAQARSTALDPNRSFIVQAPAGSGKTGLLVYRMLTLLASVEQPQQVLAITFTRKATAEMRARLLELMQAAERGDQSDDAFEQQGIDLAKRVLAKDQQLGWSLLNAPHQLQIQTIDAFCAKLTASMPWLSRLGDRPRTTDQADAHYAAAVESLLSELLNPDSAISDALQTVLLELDFNYNKARQLYSSMLTKRDQWLRHLLQYDLSSLRNQLEESWQAVNDEQIEQLQRQLSDGAIEQLVDLASYAAQNIKPKEGQVSILSSFETFVHQDHEIRFASKQLSLEQWQSLCRLLLVADGKSFRKTVTITQGFVAKSVEKTRMMELLAEFAGDDVLRALIADVAQLPTPRFSDRDWQQLQALEVVLKSLAAFLQLRFRSVGECDHSEVTQRANLALQELDNPTDLALRMDYQLQHILVDEFQDTSNGQIELLKKLTLGWSR
nr:UvrD-helicase domain-containing protein [Acidiferrobacterales bacterium]